VADSQENIAVNKVDIACLCGVFLLLLCVLRPFGNFPINDDWAYARAAFTLAQTGRLEICAWPSMTQVAHILWGALFCKLFGASFVTLRISTMVLSLCSIVLTYLLLIECRSPRWFALLAAATILANPIFLVLSCTYMTDVTFFCMQVLSIWMFLRAEHRRSLPCYIVAIVSSVAATLIRQIGLVVPVAFALAIMWRARRRLNWLVICASIAPVLVAGLSLHGYEEWLKSSGQWSGRYRFLDQTLSDYLASGRYLSTLLEVRYFILQCGLWLTPLVLARLPAAINTRRRLLVFAIVLVLLTICLNDGLLFVSKGNVLNAYGLGPFEWKDVNALLENSGQIGSLPYGFWLVLTDLGLAMAVGFISLLATQRSNAASYSSSNQSEHTLFAVLIVLLNGACLFISTPIFDRYYIQFLPALIMLIAPTSVAACERKTFSRLACVVGCFAVFSVAAVHDYLAINQARWDLLNELTQRLHVTPRQIDGGIEFNGFYLFDPYYIQKPGCDPWWVDADRYAVTFGPLPGYKLFETRPCQLWLLSAPARVCLLERVNDKLRIKRLDIPQQQDESPERFASAANTILLLQQRTDFVSKCSALFSGVTNDAAYSLDVRGEDPQINLNVPLPSDSRPKQLCLDMQVPHRTLFQIFYSNGESQPFSEGRSIQKTLEAGRRLVYLELPADCVKLRIDPGNTPGVYKLYRLEIRD
jgi:4-amino-4-deoxy-L-arabinose transferase-like glycosyltransferase